MTRTMMDSTGNPVALELVKADVDGVASYRVAVQDGLTAGRADFIDLQGAENERVFFHTEVDPAYKGRGLAGLLLTQALADSAEQHVVVIPVCPFFARHLRDHGEEFRASGGQFRRPTAGDVATVKLAMSHRRSRSAIAPDEGNGP